MSGTIHAHLFMYARGDVLFHSHEHRLNAENLIVYAIYHLSIIFDIVL